jgi:hypothetical protein
MASNTPRVNIRFENNNIQPSTPALGISHVVALTTKGPDYDPSTVITSLTQFNRIFGEEVVTDNQSASQIERALSLGSMLRISRVLPSDADYGTATVNGKATVSAQVQILFTNPNDSTQTAGIAFEIQSKEKGTLIQNQQKVYYKIVIETSNNIRKYILQRSTASGANFDANKYNEQTFLIAGTSANPWVDSNALYSLVTNDDEFVLASFLGLGLVKNPNDVTDISSMIASYGDWSMDVQVLTDTATWGILSNTTGANLLASYAVDLDAGTKGTAALTSTDWIKGYEALKEYFDAYQLFFSSVHHSLDETNLNALYTAVAKDVTKNFETVLYIEIPYTEDTPTKITAKANAYTALMGAGSKNIALFAGGLSYYDNNGQYRNNDILGTVAGLGDTNAARRGPWSSFAGANRGLVPDAVPVIANLGSPNKVEDLQALAQANVNLFVTKSTRLSGMTTMLWHLFTTEPKFTSDRFLTITRLNLYLKKNIRPILESYIEEPNTFSTWRSIFNEVQPILTNLVNANAFMNPVWYGDQTANSFAQMTVNNEADVRAGKYKAILRYTDIVTLQIIDLLISINKVESTITINQ